MKISTLATPILLSIASLVASCAQSKPTSNSFARCYQTLEEIKRDIEVTRKGKIAYISVFEINEHQSSPIPPFPRKTGIMLALGDQRMKRATESELEASLKIINPTLTQQYAANIIKNCDEVSKVLIGQSFSGNKYSYSYMGKGEIKQDTCIEHPKKRQWGEQWCS